MKLPNGYGSVIKLGGNRRKKFAVRISCIDVNLEEKEVKQKYKYIGYFEKREAALKYLAEYNAGHPVKEHQKYTDVLTFEELYEKWKDYRKALKTQLSDSTWKNYEIAFSHFEDIHLRKITTLKPIDLQECLNKWNTKSKTTIGSMRTVLKSMFSYAMMQELIDTDSTIHLIYEYTKPTESKHSRFSDEEIQKLWDNLYEINNVDIVLIMIYTGLRPTELLNIATENVFLDKLYMVGGMKTEAGFNRIIPLHNKIIPLIRNRYNPDKKYLINNKFGNHYTYGTYMNGNFDTLMKKIGMKHTPHDGRYTFAALADNAGMNEVCQKIIMGHSLADKSGKNFKTGSNEDITKGVYTQKTLEELLVEINKI